MAAKKLIDANEAVKKLQAVKKWFGGNPYTEQNHFAQAVVDMCIEEIKKIQPAEECK